MYPILMVGANFEAGRVTSEVNVFFWHNPDLQHPLELGPIMPALPTFGAECLVFAAFQTWRRGVAKVGT